MIGVVESAVFVRTHAVRISAKGRHLRKAASQQAGAVCFTGMMTGFDTPAVEINCNTVRSWIPGGATQMNPPRADLENLSRNAIEVNAHATQLRWQILRRIQAQIDDVRIEVVPVSTTRLPGAIASLKPLNALATESIETSWFIGMGRCQTAE